MSSTTLLYSDLQRQGDTNIRYEAPGCIRIGDGDQIEVPILAVREGGKRFAIALSGPLTIDHPADLRLAEAREKATSVEFIVINELLVRGNLPAATREVRQRLGV